MATKRPATLVEEYAKPGSRRIRAVSGALVRVYGRRKVERRDPLDGLILILLSQATNDINCDRAFRSLKQCFPTWQEAREAPVDVIADSIRMGGLTNQKAARIKGLLEEIAADSQDLDLTWMHGASPRACRAYLGRFHGVGPKT